MKKEIIDNKVPLLYISGWMGNGKESGTYRWLERHFGNIEAYATGGQTDVGKMIDDLNGIIEDLRSKYGELPILVANSYGSFLASFYSLDRVMINPALFPSKTLPKIAELSDEDIKRFMEWETRRAVENEDPLLRQNTFCICSEDDEIISGHCTATVSSKEPVMIPEGLHRLTNKQRDIYLLPVIENILASKH